MRFLYQTIVKFVLFGYERVLWVKAKSMLSLPGEKQT
jgi:hypothetical protein